MAATAVRPTVRFARFILSPSVASRRYLYSFWNPKDAKGKLKPGATAADVKRYEDLLAANDGNPRIQFRSKANMGPGAEEVVFITNSQVTAAALRADIRAGRLKAREDVTVAPLQCPWCDFALSSSTPQDQEKMYFHHLDDHPEKLNEMVGEAIPAPAA